MKRRGCQCVHNDDRDRELMRKYKELVQANTHIYIPALMRQLVNSPSSRFWVSEERATIVVSSIMRGRLLHNMRPSRREMFNEIHRRTVQLLKEKPNLCLQDAVFQVVHSPAPKFYLTPNSAKVILSRIKTRLRNKRNQR